MVAYLLTVESQFVVAKPTDIDASAPNRFADGHIGSKIQGAPKPATRVSDPFPLPILGRQKRHFPVGDVTVRAGCAILVPGANLPVVTTARGESWTLEQNLVRLVGGNFAGIPDIRLVAAKLIFIACDKNLIGGLLLTSLARGKDPTEMWFQSVDPERVYRGFASWTGDTDLSVRNEDRDNCELHDQEQGTNRMFHHFNFPSRERPDIRGRACVTCPDPLDSMSPGCYFLTTALRALGRLFGGLAGAMTERRNREVAIASCCCSRLSISPRFSSNMA